MKITDIKAPTHVFTLSHNLIAYYSKAENERGRQAKFTCE